MNRLFVFVCLLLLFVVPFSAQAQTRFGVRAGVADGEPMVGGEVVVPLSDNFVFNPNLELTSELFSVNADFHYDFRINRRTAWWLGAGAALIKPDSADSDFGVNLLAGIGTRHNNVYPYAQIKLTAPADYDEYGSIAVGLRF